MNSYAPHAGLLLGSEIFLFTQHREIEHIQHPSSGYYNFGQLNHEGIRYWCERQKYNIAAKVWDTMTWRNCYPNMGKFISFFRKKYTYS